MGFAQPQMAGAMGPQPMMVSVYVCVLGVGGAYKWGVAYKHVCAYVGRGMHTSVCVCEGEGACIQVCVCVHILGGMHTSLGGGCIQVCAYLCAGACWWVHCL